MGMSTQGLASIVLVILLGFALTVYYVIFQFVLTKPPVANDQPTPEISEKTAPPTTNVMFACPGVSTDGLELGGAAAEIAKDTRQSMQTVVDPSEIVVVEGRSRFGDGVKDEFVYNNTRARTFHSVAIDRETIKVVEVWSRYRQQVAMAYDRSEMFERTLATADFTCEMKAAPLSLFTHVESQAIGYNLPILLMLYRNLMTVLYFIERNVIYFMGFFFLLVIIVTFYVPGSNDLSTTGDDRASQSRDITGAMMIFTVLTTIGHMILIRFLNRPKVGQDVQITAYASILPLILCFCLVFSLYSIVNGGDTSNSSSDSTQSAARHFVCGCPETSSSSNNGTNPTQFPTYSPSVAVATSTEYAFQCTNALLQDVNGDSCNMNCGVCGDTYRDPFLAFTVFAAIYFLMLLYLVFYQFYFDYIVIPLLIPHYTFKPFTHMYVTIHGSEAFGYPLHTRLTVQDTMKLTTLLSDYSAEEKERRTGDFLNHMKHVGSSITGQSIQRQTTKNFDMAFKFLWFAIKFCLRLVGISL